MTRTWTACITCGRRIPVGSGGRCASHRPVAARIRSSWAWTRLRAQLRSTGRCSACGAIVGPALLDVDHVIPARDRPDLALEPSNLQVLCRPCHRAKSKRDG